MNPEFNDSIFEGSQPEGQGLNTKQITEHLLQQKKELEKTNGLFIVRKGSERLEAAKNQPIPRLLFDEFWAEGEVCILFGNNGSGKSILAVQIGLSIAEGSPIQGLKFEASRQSVLYCDFENSDKTYESRLSENYDNHYQLADIFYTLEMNIDADLPEGDFDEFLLTQLEKEIQKHKFKVIIVDNITYIKNETEQAKDALPLMKKLRAMTKKLGLSLLVIAHTPKRDESKPITKNDLAGSKQLSNFAESMFALGSSHQEAGLRYLKQVKARNREEKYTSENILLCQIVKPANVLMFEFLDRANEQAHLKTLAPSQRDELIIRAKDLQKEGKTQREIAEILDIGLGTVNKYLKA